VVSHGCGSVDHRFIAKLYDYRNGWHHQESFKAFTWADAWNVAKQMAQEKHLHLEGIEHQCCVPLPGEEASK
jgi:hypothetical protein